MMQIIFRNGSYGNIWIEKATLYRLVRSRKLPSINIGLHMTKIKRSDIEQMFPRSSSARDYQAGAQALFTRA